MAGTIWDRCKLIGLAVIVVLFGLSAVQYSPLMLSSSPAVVVGPDMQPCVPLKNQLDQCAQDDNACTSHWSSAQKLCEATMKRAQKVVLKTCSPYIQKLEQCVSKRLQCGMDSSNLRACQIAVEYPFIKSLENSIDSEKVV